ncbi:DoxX-like family protein [Desulfococcaceae bacterium OttesenSCG-928-F15]|nr:DoxX-like family protein [Desulfococcaceae bacterium OttesenSCG-928-F15]
MNFTQAARYVLGLSWVYQGFFPKLFHQDSLEYEMSARLGFSHENTLMLIRITGGAEILFGLLLILFYRNAFLQKLNISALSGLLLAAFFMMPSVLLKAFNPVTTNIPLILLSFYLLKHNSLRK